METLKAVGVFYGSLLLFMGKIFTVVGIIGYSIIKLLDLIF